MTKRTLPPLVGDAQEELADYYHSYATDYKAAKIEAAMQQPGIGDSLHKLGADAIEAVLAAQQEAIAMTDTLREAAEKANNGLRDAATRTGNNASVLYLLLKDNEMPFVFTPDEIDAVVNAVRALPSLLDERDALKARVEKLEKALTPSADTKAAYIGEFKFSREVSDHEVRTYTQSYTVPWTTTKEIMAAILAYAARQTLET